ncbi:MAG TPA: hypothetical protein PLP19_13835 [bacterium]|nr:hypothetical protein [bacterium]HPN44568.1 hypothetical protein [bacterium]
MGGIRQILIVPVFILLLVHSPVLAVGNEDSTLTSSTTAMYSSYTSPYANTGGTQALPIKSLLINEIMLKRNLNRLSYMGHGRYLDSCESTAQLFYDINMYPEESKNKIFLLAIGGSIAGQALKYSRRELSKHNLGFIFPNLSGLNVMYRVEKLHSTIFMRFSNTDKIVVFSAYNGRISVNLHENSYAQQKNLAVQPLPGCQLFYLNTSYPQQSYHEIGIAAYYKKFNLYFNYIKNFSFPERNRLSVISYITL